MKRAIIIAAIAIASCLGLVLPSSAAVLTSGGTAYRPILNRHWAGYVATPRPGGTVTSFNYVQATLTIPAVTCTSSASSVSQEILVGDTHNGFNGVEIRESCQNGSPSYAAYGESQCQGNNDQIPITVSPGDTVELQASGVNGDELANNLTTGQSGRNPVSCADGGGKTAAVITFGNPGGGTDITNFTQVGFRQVQVQGSNQPSPKALGSSFWKVRPYVLQDILSGRDDVKPEALLTGKYTSSFANDWYFPN